MRNEFAVKTVSAVPGTAPRKRVTLSGPRYSYGVVYELEDGRTIQTTEYHRLLRDAKAELAQLPKSGKTDLYDLSVYTDDAGNYQGVICAFHMGARR